MYKFEENLELMNLLDVADGSRAGSIDEEKRLKRVILRWVDDDERIITPTRTKMGKVSMGHGLAGSVRVNLDLLREADGG